MVNNIVEDKLDNLRPHVAWSSDFLRMFENKAKLFFIQEPLILQCWESQPAN